jgi:hypothetical protein
VDENRALRAQVRHQAPAASGLRHTYTHTLPTLAHAPCHSPHAHTQVQALREAGQAREQLQALADTRCACVCVGALLCVLRVRRVWERAREMVCLTARLVCALCAVCLGVCLAVCRVLSLETLLADSTRECAGSVTLLGLAYSHDRPTTPSQPSPPDPPHVAILSASHASPPLALAFIIIISFSGVVIAGSADRLVCLSSDSLRLQHTSDKLRENNTKLEKRCVQLAAQGPPAHSSTLLAHSSTLLELWCAMPQSPPYTLRCAEPSAHVCEAVTKPLAHADRRPHREITRDRLAHGPSGLGVGGRPQQSPPAASWLGPAACASQCKCRMQSVCPPTRPGDRWLPWRAWVCV